MKVSKSHEDYLEAIVELGGSTEQAVRSVDIAKKMGVSKASVNKALSLLKEKGFLDQPYYGCKIVERHNLLVAFMEKVLGVPADMAEEEAHVMEHAISDDSFEKWTEYIRRLGIEY